MTDFAVLKIIVDLVLLNALLFNFVADRQRAKAFKALKKELSRAYELIDKLKR